MSLNRNQFESQQVLMAKIHMMQDLLAGQAWPEETEKQIKAKLENYRARLAALLLNEK